MKFLQIYMFIEAILHKPHFGYHRKYGDYSFCKLHNLTLIDACDFWWLFYYYSEFALVFVYSTIYSL